MPKGASGQKRTPAIEERKRRFRAGDYAHVVFCDNCRRAVGICKMNLVSGVCCKECVKRVKLKDKDAT